MTYVVTESCIKCKYTDCVDVCPVDCFKEGPNMLVIDPDECIDCAVCIPECPVNAIYPEEDLPEDQKQFVEINAELAKKWPTITEAKEPLPEGRELVAPRAGGVGDLGVRTWMRVSAGGLELAGDTGPNHNSGYQFPPCPSSPGPFAPIGSIS